MTSKHIEPALAADSFSCPHCGAIAHQLWWRLYISAFKKKDRPGVIRAEDLADPIARAKGKARRDQEENKELRLAINFVERLKRHTVTYAVQGHNEYLDSYLANVALSMCYSCDGFAVWIQDELIYPARDSGITAHEEMPDAIKEDFYEAASIVDKSPRGAAALLRLCIQKLMPALGEKGGKLNDDIASLVKKGLEADIQKALDVMRVIGNNAVHPGQIDLKDDKATAVKLFDLLNLIIERRIATPKKIGALFEGLPPAALEQIEERDKS